MRKKTKIILLLVCNLLLLSLLIIVLVGSFVPAFGMDFVAKLVLLLIGFVLAIAIVVLRFVKEKSDDEKK